MPGTILGLYTGATNTPQWKRPDRSLNFRFAPPPMRDMRDREDSPGARNRTTCGSTATSSATRR